eukprot:9279070-Pyramimonas_sp.AAC.1
MLLHPFLLYFGYALASLRSRDLHCQVALLLFHCASTSAQLAEALLCPRSADAPPHTPEYSCNCECEQFAQEMVFMRTKCNRLDLIKDRRHMAFFTSARCQLYDFPQTVLTRVSSIDHVHMLAYIRMMGPNGHSLSLGAWLKWPST